MNRALLIAVVAALLAGCQQAPRPNLTTEDFRPPTPQPAERESQVPQDADLASPPTPSPNGETVEKPAVPTPSRPNLPPAKKPLVPRPNVVRPGSDGWVEVTMTPQQFTQRLDASLMSLRNVAGAFEVDIKNTEVEGRQKGTFLVHDATLYAIESLTIDEPTLPRRFQADGESKSALTSDGWSKEVPVSAVSGAGTQATPNRLVNEFPDFVFLGLVGGRPIWADAIRQLEKAGYAVHLETKTIPSQGRPRPFYRLVAKKDGLGLNTFEMRIDGIRWAPVTIRMLATAPGNQPVTAEWRAQWSFNQKVEKTLREGRGFSPQQPQ